MTRTRLTVLTWAVVFIIVLMLSALSVAGCPEQPPKQKPPGARTTEDIGYNTIQIIEVEHDGKVYMIACWKYGNGSDMEILEVRDAEVRSNVHTD